MKPKKLKPGKCWGMVFQERSAVDVVTCDDSNYRPMTFKTKRAAMEFIELFPAWERPRLVRLEVREV
jgi:hypothetical protein